MRIMINRRTAMVLPAAMIATGLEWSRSLAATTEVIDDLSQKSPRASNGAAWELVADRVMGGVSNGTMRRTVVRGRAAIQMQGDVSLENNGGFIQIALDLAPDGAAIDASRWAGIEIDVIGNNESYNLHLRTAELARPWQSYRQSFIARPEWQTVRLLFADFEAHRIDASLNLSMLRRIGIVAIGRAFHADIAIGGVRFHS
jgi:hypothetical protein